MRTIPASLLLSAAIVSLAPAAAFAQPAGPAADGTSGWSFDPSVLVGDGREIVRRAPAGAVDELLQAITASAREPDEAEAVCRLLDPDADRSLAGLNEAAARLPPRSRERLAGAVANLLVAALQAPPQVYDEGAARQALKQAGVRAALMQDGFMAGLQGDHHPARCRSVGTLLEVMADRPRSERVAVARLLMDEGLDRLQLVASGP
ncbi:hypothetical protein LY625_07120 [Lysobacter sp. GX 14042]|uniref:hypothetical protein n=1 Tax=Lysobacter sp. GX 14042 TaxID=2907155 RepID=UPI001F340ADA|nr:hypothetical protein [Lysobacter sp. GX 14042]MCE7032393.1 hypothetical protein [Lysobacter sp. GX 14042]